jgi:hypothetical protein
MNHYPDDFLDRDFSCDPREALKNALLHKTTLIIRRRRRLHRAGTAALAAACYLLGAVTMWYAIPRAPANNDTPSTAVVIADNSKPAPPVEAPPERPELVELRALTAAPAERALQLRKAGDLYLSQANDYASALRCYTAFFNAAGDDALEFSPDDNWLVIAIKNTRSRDRENSPDIDSFELHLKNARRRERINEY